MLKGALEMNKIETAKKLLRQAQESGDLELLELASKLLEEKEDIKQTHSYVCTNCEHSFESEKERKGCPKCRKRKLKEHSLQIDIPVSPRPKMEDFTTSTKPNRDNRVRINPDTGKPDGMYTIGEQVKANTKFFDRGNKEPLDKLVKMPEVLAERRNKMKLVEYFFDTENGGCGGKFNIHPIHARNLVCDRCMMKVKRRNR